MSRNLTAFILLAAAAGGARAQIGKDLNVSRLECERVTCKASPGMQPGLTTVEMEGRGFREWGGRGVRMRVVRDDRTLVDDRKLGVMSDGHFAASIPAYRYPDGNYLVIFTPVGEDRNVIAGGRYTKQTPETNAPPQSRGAASAALAGIWRGINGTAGELDIRPNGSYTFNGAPGRYTHNGGDVVFSGPLSAWNDGRATVNRDVIEFYWTTRSGAKQWFTFEKTN